MLQNEKNYLHSEVVTVFQTLNRFMNNFGNSIFDKKNSLKGESMRKKGS
jgi:hypothetical protein